MPKTKEKEKTMKKKELKIQELEKKVLPSVMSGKKTPTTLPEPPYPPGTDYGLVKRDNLLKFNR